MPTDSASLFLALKDSDFLPHYPFCVLDERGERVFESRRGASPSVKEAHRETLSVRGMRYEFLAYPKDKSRIRALLCMIEALLVPRDPPPMMHAASAYRGFLQFLLHEIVAYDKIAMEDVVLGRCVIPSGDAFFSASLIAVILLIRSGAHIQHVTCKQSNGYMSLSVTADAACGGKLSENEPFLFELVRALSVAQGFWLTVEQEEGSVSLNLRTVCIPDFAAVMHAPLSAEATDSLGELLPLYLLKGFLP